MTEDIDDGIRRVQNAGIISEVCKCQRQENSRTACLDVPWMVMKVVSIMADDTDSGFGFGGQLYNRQPQQYSSSTAEVQYVSNLIIRIGTSGGGVGES